MKNLISLFVLFLGIFTSVFAQVNIIGQTNVSNFPEIEFTIHNRNPEIVSSSNFSFWEYQDGQRIESDTFDVEKVKDTTDYSKENKCVLIVIETLYNRYRYEQNYTFYSAIIDALDEVVNKGDKFKIVTFSLRNDKTNLLYDVNDDFSDNSSYLKDALSNHETEYNDFTNKPVSTLYGALIEAIEQLNAFESALPKSILLLSEERNNTKAGEQTSVNTITIAREKGIVINTIKYNRSGYHQYTDPTLSQQTYGLSKVLSTSSGNLDYAHEGKKNETKHFIISTLNNVVERASGINYRVSLELNNDLKDGKKHFLEVKVDDSDKIQKFSYDAPGNWVIAQFQLHVYISSGISLILLLILGYLVYYLNKRYQGKIIEEKNRRRKQREIDAQQELEISKQKEELLNIKRKEEQRKQMEEDAKAEEIRKYDEKELIKQMLGLGSFPILKYTDSSSSSQFEINNPNMTVGRDKVSNSICIPNNNISRNHFSIIFRDNEYKVVDNNSTNGIILNGRKIKESVLNNADVIQIADVTFTFYK